MQKYILSVYVANQSGVLARVSMLFGRRNYNIDSLTVSTTNDPQVSRITITVTGNHAVLEQIRLQLLKLQEVIKVEHLENESTLCRELLLVKLDVSGRHLKAKVMAEGLGARLMEETRDTMIFELTARPERVDLFLEQMRDYPILEMCRTGMTAMSYSRKPDEVI